MVIADVPYPDTVDELADALRREPVIVHEVLGGGDTTGAMERIERVVSQMPFAAYVAIIRTPREVDAGSSAGRYLAGVLSRRIGAPGLYVVATPEGVTGVRMVGTDWDETLFSLQATTDREAVEAAAGVVTMAPTVEAEVLLRTALGEPLSEPGESWEEVSLRDEVVDDLADRQRDLEPWSPPRGVPDEPEPWSPGKRWMAGFTAGGLTFALLLQSLWGWPGWRRRPQPAPAAPPRSVTPSAPEPPDPEATRAEAGRELTALAEALVTAPSGDRAHAASLAREVAEPLLSSDDPLDLVGALVLARAGRREVAIARGRAREPLRPCFFDPRHQRATAEATWRLGDGAIEVPVCRSCSRTVARGRAPQVLVVRRGRGTIPYYEGRSVWARTGFGALTADLSDLAAQVAAERERSR